MRRGKNTKKWHRKHRWAESLLSSANQRNLASSRGEKREETDTEISHAIFFSFNNKEAIVQAKQKERLILQKPKNQAASSFSTTWNTINNEVLRGKNVIQELWASIPTEEKKVHNLKLQRLNCIIYMIWKKIFKNILQPSKELIKIITCAVHTAGERKWSN